MPVLFGITLFLSAVLLFLIQPLIARMILPLLGGSPAVWLTCMVFFQTVLLAGYLYAHALSSRLRLGTQTLAHLLVLAVPLLLLPLISLPLHLARETPPVYGRSILSWLGEPPQEGSPIPWSLALLLVSIGLPFFAVSTSAPLLQKWFGHTEHAAARDPYVLYAASNAGSLAALLGYPLLVEPLLPLLSQSWLWALGYVVLHALVIACAVQVHKAGQGRGVEEQKTGQGAEQGRAGQGGGKNEPPRTSRSPRANSATASSVLSPQSSVLSWGRRFRWLALSAVPSSLLLGVTTYLSTDIAAVPLLWIAPLVLYLLTFILAFAARQFVPAWLAGLFLPALMIFHLFGLLVAVFGIRPMLAATNGLHLLTFLSAALVCHGELAADRPPADHLTEFYLWLSLGGLVGGLFNALAAPLLFTSTLEYPLVLLLACLVGTAQTPWSWKRDAAWKEPRPGRKGRAPQTSFWRLLVGWLLPPALGVVACLLMVYLLFDVPGLSRTKVAAMLGIPLVLYGSVCFFGARPLWFGVPIGVMLIALGGLSTRGTLLHAERGFYGVLRVTTVRDDERQEEFIQLFHGSTMHGRQRRSDDPVKRRAPLTYYHEEGPIGRVFKEFSGNRAKQHVGLVGLGTGSLASYGEPGQEFTFYEIDDAVVRLARDSGYFTFLKECRAKYDIVLGDARLSLKRAKDGQYGLLVIDAFSSDAIPVHLLTREACEQVYLKKLANDGVLAFHISNRYLDLRPVLGNLAQALKLVARVYWDEQGDEKSGRAPSMWVILAHKEADLGKLAGNPLWQPLPPRPGMAVWTDDYSNLLSVVKW